MDDNAPTWEAFVDLAIDDPASTVAIPAEVLLSMHDRIERAEMDRAIGSPGVACAVVVACLIANLIVEVVGLLL